MGCTQSKIENEETVTRCKERKHFMKEAVSARNAFAAAHSAYTMSLKNTGAALSDYAHGEVQFSSTAAAAAAAGVNSPLSGVTPPLSSAPLDMPPPPPLPPFPNPSFSPSPLQRAATMPEIAIPTPDPKRSEMIIEEENEEEMESESMHGLRHRSSKSSGGGGGGGGMGGRGGVSNRQGIENEELSTPPSPPPRPPPQNNRTPPPPPPPDSKGMSSWDFFFPSMENVPGPTLAEVDESRIEREELERKMMEERAKRAENDARADETERVRGKNKGLVLPSIDFQRLCIEQLDLFRRIVHPDALLSVYVRPAGSYVMDRLELQRITLHPHANATDLVILIGNFSIPAGLRIAEATLSRQEVELFPELGSVVFPMVKHPFIVGFLVAELPRAAWNKGGFNVKGWPAQEEIFSLPPSTDLKSLNIKTSSDHSFEMLNGTAEQRLNAINISRSLAMAYVMDQKANLLQQSTWQNNIRMSNLVEQIRGSLSSIRTLSKMLSVQIRKSEISYDIVQDILEQGDCLSDTLKGLQDAVSLTKANIMHYSEETLKRMPKSTYPGHDSARSQLSDNLSEKLESLSSKSKDLEMPMPPLALAPLRHEGVRPCNVSDVLVDLVGAVAPLAHEQRRAVLLSEVPRSLPVPVEEPSLRQALGNLIEGALLRIQAGGKVEIIATEAPAGGALVIIDDDGLDMHYMTQMHSLAPFGADLFSEDRVKDNMTWNFVAGLTVSREILESYGCVVRVISPRVTDAAIGTGGTRVELWFPSSSASSVMDGPSHEV